jgi:2-methylcitrate dehydratase PrpD
MLHTTVDAIEEIRQKHAVQPSKVSRVVVHTFSDVVKWLVDYRPQSVVDATFSGPYVAALVLSGYRPGPQWYSPANLGSRRLTSLADKVDFRLDTSLELAYRRERLYPSRVELTMKDGARFQSTKHHSRVITTERELLVKFLSQASPTMPKTQVRALWRRLTDFANLRDVNYMRTLLAIR